MSIFKAFVILLIATCAHADMNAIRTESISSEMEDGYILQAFEALEQNDFKSAGELYEEFYQKSRKLEYLNEAIVMQLLIPDFRHALILLESYLKQDQNNKKLNRLYPETLFATGARNKALSEAKKLVERDKSTESYEVLGRIHYSRYELAEAIKAYESAFEISKDERILLVISDIYFAMKNPSRAISLLEMHVRLNGCSVLICDRLNAIYSEKRDYPQQQRILQKLYETVDDSFAYPLLNVMLKRGEYGSAIALLEKSGINDEVLLDLYRMQKRLYDAQKLAKTLYERTQSLEVLGVWALLEYENASDKNDPKLLESVKKKLEALIEKQRDHVSLNFLGYMLIDHDMDVARGVSLVKEALEQKPDSPHYIDSLAWGYYKLGKCDDALKEMEHMQKSEREAEVEIVEHYEAIKQCATKSNQQ